MSIVVDRPKPWGWRLGPSSHLMSTLPGAAGTVELMAFARRLGMRPAWLQNRGQETEHFDLTRQRHEDALRLGAVLVTSKQLVTVIRAKRANKEAA